MTNKFTEHTDKSLGPLGQYYKQAHGYYIYPKLEGALCSRMKFMGNEVLTWSINNYLALANHPEVREADLKAVKQYGLGYPMGSRMMTGNTCEHEKLEKDLAAFVKKEDGLLLNYGYQGMVSIIEKVAKRNDVVLFDSDSHACIMDGLRLQLGKRFSFLHNDIERLEKLLVKAQKRVEASKGKILVITEGVFGMTGQQGKLSEIVELKKKYPFLLLVDDAHGFGVMGKTGAGTHQQQNVMDQVDIYFLTFAKAMAGIGAFVGSSALMTNYFRYNLRSQIYAKSLPIAMVLGIQKRFEMMVKYPELKQQLWTVTNALQKGLKNLGYDLGLTNSQITPVYIKGSLDLATSLTKQLREKYKIFCSIVTYPVVPKGIIILRLIPTASHSLSDVNETLEAFKELKKEIAAAPVEQ